MRVRIAGLLLALLMLGGCVASLAEGDLALTRPDQTTIVTNQNAKVIVQPDGTIRIESGKAVVLPAPEEGDTPPQ